jgi:hypothetical protein
MWRRVECRYTAQVYVPVKEKNEKAFIETSLPLRAKHHATERSEDAAAGGFKLGHVRRIIRRHDRTYDKWSRSSSMVAHAVRAVQALTGRYDYTIWKGD